MDYFNNKVERHLRYKQEGLPDWLPKNGLIYYDTIPGYSRIAMTGQQYTEVTGSNDNPRPLDFQMIGGKRCLYKNSTNDNYLTFNIYDSPQSVTDYTWGCWVYDTVGTCYNQQVFRLMDQDGLEYNYLSFSGTNSRLIVAHRSVNEDNASAYCYYNKGAIVGEWRFIYGWHGSGWFGPRMPPLEDGNNLGAAQDTRIAIATATLMPKGCFGAAIRGAFIYNRVITAAEGMAIYNGSKDEQ